VGDSPVLLLLTSPGALIAAALFGAVWGSFFNVCIARIPRGESVVRPPSHCFSCGRTVRPWDNIPILSYIVLRGRCRFCGVRFSPRYLLVELLVAVLSALVYWRFVLEADAATPPGLRVARYVLYFAFTGVMVVLSFIDLDTQQLPDIITLPSIPVFFAAAFAVQDVPWLSRLIGVALGYGMVRLISDGYYYLTGREGLGMGDGKLLAGVGALLGWRAFVVVIFLASFLGILVSVPVLMITRRKGPGSQPAPAAPPPLPPEGAAAAPEGAAAQTEGAAAADDETPSLRHSPIPFGPFLALSAVVYLLCGGDALWNWLLDRLAG
jgi:leader peptidase (prepilin peptidase)/N-methyltransferase